MSIASRLTLLSNRYLQLVLMPTEQCNFRCVYCYEDFALGQMEAPVVNAVKALIGRRISSLDVLALEWFGGEPLLAFPVIQEIQSFAQELLLRYPKVRLLGSITTNASLLDRRRHRELLALDIRKYQISLDGGRLAHDSTRLRQGGGGTFRTIWRNLLGMRESHEDFEVLLHLHLTRDNLPSMYELLDDLAGALGGDARFSVIFKPIRRFGGPNDAALRILDPEKEGEIVARFVAKATEIGLLEKQDVASQPGMLPGCFASALGSYVVRATGELAKCTVALAHPNNRIGMLQPDGSVQLDGAKMTGWLRGTLGGQPEIIECPMQGWADEIPTDSTQGLSGKLVQLGGAPLRSRAQ